MREAKKIRLSHIEAYDAENETSLVRELEMAVDSLVPEQGYAAQFFYDLRVYNLSEAKAYLLNYLDSKSKSVEQDGNFHKVFDRICVACNGE